MIKTRFVAKSCWKKYQIPLANVIDFSSCDESRARETGECHHALCPYQSICKPPSSPDSTPVRKKHLSTGMEGWKNTYCTFNAKIKHANGAFFTAFSYPSAIQKCQKTTLTRNRQHKRITGDFSLPKGIVSTTHLNFQVILGPGVPVRTPLGFEGILNVSLAGCFCTGSALFSDVDVLKFQTRKIKWK